MTPEEMQNQQTATDLSEQEQIRREKLQKLVEAGNDPYTITRYDRTHTSQQIIENYDALENQEVCIAGRMLARRIMGKASFAHLQDNDGKIQIYVKRDDVGEEAYAAFKQDDIGDIFGVKGLVFKTKTGEVSVHASEIILLTKSLKPLPEKFHGLTNTDMRYRQRYVDLIMNPESKDTLVKRSKIITAIRRYLDTQNFIEVETPVLVHNAGGAAARPFMTHFNALDLDM
ncbi:MAG: lysine--tRNA ligase, partial [Clostridia bacterium]|nr:lysine--tRNA ligase [Clostridia bacterium]